MTHQNYVKSPSSPMIVIQRHGLWDTTQKTATIEIFSDRMEGISVHLVKNPAKKTVASGLLLHAKSEIKRGWRNSLNIIGFLDSTIK
jgi:hypothetical protein